MHPRDSASREIRHRRPMEIPPLKTTAKGPLAETPRTRFSPPTDRLESTPPTSSASAPFLWGDANAELHCVTRMPRIQSHQRKCGNGPAHSAENRAGFTS